MQTFTNQKTITKQVRQVYSGNKSSFATLVGGNLSCYLRPLNEEQSSVNGVQFGLGFMIIFECDVDIQQGDKLEIEGKEYTVRGVVNHDRGGYTRYKRAVATLPEKQ